MAGSSAMAAFVDKLKLKLVHYGPVSLIENKNQSVEVPAVGEDGFSVTAASSDHGFVVGYERWHWHEDFEAEDEAVNCFMNGVFGESRLAVEKRGGFTQSWTAEAMIEGKWVPISKTALFLFPFWRKRTIQYFRNDRTPREPAD